MNLLTGTVDDLRKLIASVDDRAGHHFIWVDKLANVFIERLQEGVMPSDLEKQLEAKNMEFRYETYISGNDYVGANAASDEVYVQELFNGLKRHWDAGSRGFVNF